jgi:hypothetical protein
LCADNECVPRVRNIIILTGILLALGATSAAAVAVHSLSCSNCGSFTASGDGWVGQTMTGTGWGSVANGTIRVKDLSPNDTRDFQVSHASSHRTLEDGTIIYSGKGMTFVAWTHWYVKVKGTNVSVSTVAAGSAYVQGSGKYHVNSGAARSWPQTPKPPAHITVQG